MKHLKFMKLVRVEVEEDPHFMEFIDSCKTQLDNVGNLFFAYDDNKSELSSYMFKKFEDKLQELWPEEGPGKLYIFKSLNKNIEDKEAKAVVYESFNNIVNKYDAYDFRATSIGFFFLFHERPSDKEMKDIEEELSFMNVDGKFRRALLQFGAKEDFQVYEMKGTKEEKKVEPLPKEENFLRSSDITLDDITDMKIQLGLSQDVNDFIDSM